MATVGQRATLIQRRVLGFFKDALGYRYLGHWKDRTVTSTRRRKCAWTREERLWPRWGVIKSSRGGTRSYDAERRHGGGIGLRTSHLLGRRNNGI